MRYESYRYFPPPRTENKIPMGMLGFYEKQGWLAQAKKNGTNAVVFVSPEKKLTMMNRHGSALRWTPPPETAALLSGIPGTGWHVLNGELLHHKTKSLKNVLYLFDVLVWDGDYLLDQTYAERYNRLQLIFMEMIQRSHRAQHHPFHSEVGSVWLAKNYGNNFAWLFGKLDGEVDEGLMLKNPTARGFGGDWMVKCRRPTKNFGF
jgi:hypothetical protein